MPGLGYDPLDGCKKMWFDFVQKMMSGKQADFFDTDIYLKSQPSQPYYPAVMMYRKFTLSAAAKSARIYMTAHGIYEFYINGVSASDASTETIPDCF